MKTQMMQFRVNDEERALIEKCAKKAGMTVAEYIRACMHMEMVGGWRSAGIEDHWPNDRNEGDGCAQQAA